MGSFKNTDACRFMWILGIFFLKASPDDSGGQPRFRIPALKCVFPKLWAGPEFPKYVDIQAQFSFAIEHWKHRILRKINYWLVSTTELHVYNTWIYYFKLLNVLLITVSMRHTHLCFILIPVIIFLESYWHRWHFFFFNSNTHLVSSKQVPKTKLPDLSNCDHTAGEDAFSELL